jgi:hypothetical protein
MPLLSSKFVDEKINHFFLNWLPSGDRAENFFRNIISTKKLMEKSYSETEQNMSEKQGKGQIMLHLPMKFENHAMNRENEFKRSWSG